MSWGHKSFFDTSEQDDGVLKQTTCVVYITNLYKTDFSRQKIDSSKVLSMEFFLI